MEVSRGASVLFAAIFFVLEPLLSAQQQWSPMYQDLGQLKNSTELSGVMFAKPGDSVNFTWALPPSLRDSLLLVSFQRPPNILFLTTTLSSSTNSPVVTASYTQRLQVMDNTLEQGLVQFTLNDVTAPDGGKYICTTGLTEADVVEHCGSSLVVIGVPINITVMAEETPLTGRDITLRCSADSSSQPRDHHQPMRFRWYEKNTSDKQGHANAHSEWIEMNPTRLGSFQNAREMGFQDLNDPGSGDVDPEVVKGSDSGSLDDRLRIESLGREDEGRRFVCRASEGLDVWSESSYPFLLTPEWQPTPSDVTMTPADKSLTLTTGESTQVTCSAECRPECTTVWKKMTSDDDSITLSTDGRLTLHRVGVSQQGLYRCVASNTHGSAFITLTIHVKDAPVPWYRDTKYVIIVVAIATVFLALVIIAIAVVVYRCRLRSTPIVWPHRRRNQDAVPLSILDTRPSLSSDC